MKTLFITTSIFLTLAFAVLPSRGDTLTVGIIIANLGQSSGPLALDFGLQDGSGTGDANNTFHIGGLYFDAPLNTPGGAQDAQFNLNLTDTAVSQDLVIGLWPVTTGAELAFSTTTAVDSGGTPDRFSIKILDNSGIPIPTEGPGDAFLILDIDSANPVFQTFRSDLARTPIDIPAPGVSYDFIPIPDSGVPTILVIALWGSALLIRRRQVSA